MIPPIGIPPSPAASSFLDGLSYMVLSCSLPGFPLFHPFHPRRRSPSCERSDGLASSFLPRSRGPPFPDRMPHPLGHAPESLTETVHPCLFKLWLSLPVGALMNNFSYAFLSFRHHSHSELFFSRTSGPNRFFCFPRCLLSGYSVVLFLSLHLFLTSPPLRSFNFNRGWAKTRRLLG